MLHLIETGEIESQPPRSVGKVGWREAGTIELHDFIATVSVSTGSGKDRPIGIAADIGSLPTRLGIVVKTLGNVFIRGFSIKHRLHGGNGQGLFNVAPIVFLCFVGDWVILVSHALVVAAMPTLEHVEVYPLGFGEEQRRASASAGMESHQMPWVNGAYGACQSLPHLSLDSPLYVASDYPNDVGAILVTIGQEGSILHSLFLGHLSALY